MEKQCVFCFIRHEFLCTFKLRTFKAVSALQAGVINLAVVWSFSAAPCVLCCCHLDSQYADFLTSDCDSPPMDVTMFRSVALSSQTSRLSDTNDGAVNDLFL
jgi:hypothetical protein